MMLWTFKAPKDQPTRLKGLDLETDPIRGYPALRDDAREVLAFVGQYCWDSGLPLPVVTEIGRIAEDMEALYYQTELQRIEAVVTNGEAEQLARKMARERKSPHRVDDVKDGKSRAFDLRSWIYTETQRAKIRAVVTARFRRVQVLHHQVVGDAWHFHFGVLNAKRRRV